MPLTFTGRLVRPGGTAYPSLIDIAVSLSRQPRFAGHCRRWWSVLDHTLFCDELVKGAAPGNRPARLVMLLHDAHEAITADVPSDCKGSQLKGLQHQLDSNIADAFFIHGAGGYRVWSETIKRIDRRALCAEAQVVGPPATPERTLELFGVCEETHEDVSWLTTALSSYPWRTYLGQPPHMEMQERHPAVREYLKRMTELL